MPDTPVQLTQLQLEQITEMISKQAELIKKLDRIDNALFGIEEGETESFIGSLKRQSKLYERATWLTKVVIWMVPAAAVLLSSWDSIIQWFTKASS